MRANEGVLLAAENAGEVVGFFARQIACDEDPDETPDSAFHGRVSDTTVRPDGRGQAIGQAPLTAGVHARSRVQALSTTTRPRQAHRASRA